MSRTDHIPEQKASPWNSLEIAKLAVSIIMSVVLAFVGWKISEASKTEERVLQKRMEIYEYVGQRLNTLYQFYFWVGSWKDITPEQVTATKRELDAKVYTYRSFFSDQFFDKYTVLMSKFFRTENRWREDARMRTRIDYRVPPETMTEAAWKGRFTNEDLREDTCQNYYALLRQVAVELKLEVQTAAETFKCPIYPL